MSRETLIGILDRARWAPSGDNTQPWRFEIVAGNQIAIHGFDTREHVIYDFEGRPSQMAHGALIETLRIAATGFELVSEWQLRSGCSETAPIYDIFLRREQGLAPDPLLPYIEKRIVQRRPMRTTPLTVGQRQSLTLAVGDGFSLQFFEAARDRLKVAGLLWENAYIRLTCPEAYRVHKEIIEWGVRFSKDRLPEGAIGIDPLTAKLMKWVMASWRRVAFFNRFLAGTFVPRVQLDFIPALACAAHVLVRPLKSPKTLTDYVEAGVAMQRLWLTATACGLQLQPEMTPVIFRWYARGGKSISALPKIDIKANLLADRLEKLALATTTDEFLFFCRVGSSVSPWSRSTRKDLESLMLPPVDQ